MKPLHIEEITQISGGTKDMITVSDGILHIELGPIELTAMGAGTLYGMYLSNGVSPLVGALLPLGGCIAGAMVAKTAITFFSADK